MTATVHHLLPRPPTRETLYNDFLYAVAAVQQEYPLSTIGAMRRCVQAYDVWYACVAASGKDPVA